MSAERRAARIWRLRERTEHEAASLFTRLAADLRASAGSPALVELASRCADDERQHAQLCRAIVDDLEPGLAALVPDAQLQLGPARPTPTRVHGAARPTSRDTSVTRAENALYASVALGCVTESLSTALLLEIRLVAEQPSVRHAVGIILEDEVRHARLGWAHLELAAKHGDVSWLAPSIAAMLRVALDGERLSDPEVPTGIGTLARFGILDPHVVERVCRATIEQVITPGLARHGIAPTLV